MTVGLGRIKSIILKFKSLLFRPAKAFKTPEDYPLTSFQENKDRISNIDLPIYDIDLRLYLVRFLKTEWQGKINLSKYRIYLSSGMGFSKFSGVFRDTQYTFIFVKADQLKTKKLKNKALACIGFEPVEDAVIVKQIQGVHEKKNDLQPFRWEKMLLTLVMDWARENGFKSIQVIQAKDSHWYSDSRKDKMYLKYDVTARRCGFKFDNELQRYIFSLI